VLNDPDYIVGGGADTIVKLGAFLEVIIAIACIGSGEPLIILSVGHKLPGRLPQREGWLTGSETPLSRSQLTVSQLLSVSSNSRLGRSYQLPGEVVISPEGARVSMIEPFAAPFVAIAFPVPLGYKLFAQRPLRCRL
jgi:hypothetical protein